MTVLPFALKGPWPGRLAGRWPGRLAVAMAGHIYIIFNLKYMYDMIRVIGKIMNLAQNELIKICF